jgi:hyperosmotically inducible protein
MTRIYLRKVLALITGLSALPLMVGLTGCAGDPHHQSPGPLIDDHRTAKPGDSQSTDLRMEDRRMAERVREALAASADYKYDRVKVVAFTGVVQLTGFVSTNAQRVKASEVALKVAGVQIVKNTLVLKD